MSRLNQAEYARRRSETIYGFTVNSKTGECVYFNRDNQRLDNEPVPAKLREMKRKAEIIDPGVRLADQRQSLSAEEQKACTTYYMFTDKTAPW